MGKIYNNKAVREEQGNLAFPVIPQLRGVGFGFGEKAEAEKPIFAVKVKEVKEPTPIQAIFQETLPFETTAISDDKELFVEVGDWVNYCDIEKADHKYRIRIVEGSDNISEGIINERRPIAHTALVEVERFAGELPPITVHKAPGTDR